LILLNRERIHFLKEMWVLFSNVDFLLEEGIHVFLVLTLENVDFLFNDKIFTSDARGLKRGDIGF
jgi:hypothetical protein